MKYAEQSDWVMVGVKEVDLKLNPLQNVSRLDRDCRSGESGYEDTLVKSTQTYMMFGPVWNKLYRTSIVRKNNLQFVTKTNLNEDRIFNMQYACYAHSVALTKYVGYNYVVNPNSITHGRIQPSEFLNTGLEMDEIFKTELLGVNMQRYTANFACRFITRAMIEGAIHGDVKDFGRAFVAYFKSYSFRRHPLRTIVWSVSYIVGGIKRKKKVFTLM